MTVCYDLRFPELFRILAVRGAGLDHRARPRSRCATGRDHWQVLLRARAIENQAFVLAPNQSARRRRTTSSYGHSMIVDPWGVVLATAADGEGFVAADLDLGGAGAGPRLAALARQPPARGLRLAAARWRRRLMAKAPPIDKRRQILDAAIRVFARQGFHSTRVSDIADEAGVAYGLVYHYFKSKDEVLNELFSERWSLLLAAIEEADGSEARRATSWTRWPASSSTPTATTRS